MTSDPHLLQDETNRQTVFAAWLEAHYQAIVRYCVARLGALQGEDVAQEVFVAAWEGLPTCVPRPDLPLEAWLVGIARNKCLDAAWTRPGRGTWRSSSWRTLRILPTRSRPPPPRPP